MQSSGDWTQAIRAANLTAGAGSDLPTQFESGSAATVQSITSKNSWSVSVSKSDALWNSNLTLWVRRTSDGTGGGTISGGQSYVQVTSISTVLYSGSKDRSGIQLQYRISGISKGVPPSLYNTGVVFTLTP